MFKKYGIIFLIGFLGGVAGTMLPFFIFPERLKEKLPGNLFTSSQDAVLEDDKNKILSLPLRSLTPDFWEKIVAESSLSAVAIQVFKDNKIARQGSGVILSSDGLVVATSDLILREATYQIVYEDKISRGSLVFWDFKRNLAMFKIQVSNLNISDINRQTYKSGQDVLVTGKLVHLSKSTPVSQRGTISYILDERIVLDTNVNNFLNGTKAVNSAGELIGIAYLRSGKIYIIPSQDIDDFFKEYLEKIK